MIDIQRDYIHTCASQFSSRVCIGNMPDIQIIDLNICSVHIAERVEQVRFNPRSYVI